MALKLSFTCLITMIIYSYLFALPTEIGTSSKAGVATQYPLSYPDTLAVKGIKGTVIMSIKVMPDSTIGSILIVRSAGILDSLAIKAVKSWTYVPAIENGKAIISYIDVKLKYPPESTIDPKAKKLIATYKTQIDSLIKQEETKQSHIITDPIFYPESFHLLNPLTKKQWYQFNQMYYISQNPYQLYLQNLLPFTENDNQDNIPRFTTINYDLPVTLAKASLGTGSYSHNFAFFRIGKSDIIGIDHLSGSFSYLGDEGFYYTNNEKKANFQTKLTYHVDVDKELSFHYFSAKQDIPSYKVPSLLFTNSESLVNSTYSIVQMSEESPYFNTSFAVSHEYVSSDITGNSLQEDLIQIMLQKELLINTIPYNISYQIEQSKEQIETTATQKKQSTNHWINIDWQKQYNHLYLQQKVSSRLQSQDNLVRVQQKIGYHIMNYQPYLWIDVVSNDLKPHLFRYAYSNSERKELMTGIQYIDSIYHIDIQTGWKEIHQYQYNGSRYNLMECRTPAMNVLGTIHTTLSNFFLSNELRTNLVSNHGTSWYLPSIHLCNTVSAEYPLSYGNSVSASLECVYWSPFTTPSNLSVNQNSALNAAITLRLTHQFDISIELRNLTNRMYVYDNPMSGTYIASYLNWYFIN